MATTKFRKWTVNDKFTILRLDKLRLCHSRCVGSITKFTFSKRFMFPLNQPDGSVAKVTFRLLKYFTGRKLHEVFVLQICRILATIYNVGVVEQY